MLGLTVTWPLCFAPARQCLFSGPGLDSAGMDIQTGAPPFSYFHTFKLYLTVKTVFLAKHATKKAQ